ncbi:DUF6445 family protein [Pseudomonas sp. C9-3]|uniref:DUF6445 family protein n=1 Tax=Pseudomonas sp. C9-3 TaxID=3078264 RepID=UPI0028E1CB7E|nr:DUF6445 family protein [Pseudomonas sp. C9-3]
MLIIDNFLTQFADLQAYAFDAKYQDEVNDIDGVTYPQICRDIPRAIREEVLQRLALIKGAPVTDYTMFLRRSPAGVHCPHQVHSDNSMGVFSFMLYLNRPEHCQGGTSMVRHLETGVAFAPERAEFLDAIRADQNTPDAWAIVQMIDMVPNRGAVFEANTLHRAEPVGGFGEGAEGRVVLTCFFT